MADVAMPRLSDSMEEGTILKWLKSDGDEVDEGEELVEIETDKANMTYEADEAGVLKIVAQEGDTLSVGETIAQIGEGGGDGGDGDEEDETEATADSNDEDEDETEAKADSDDDEDGDDTEAKTDSDDEDEDEDDTEAKADSDDDGEDEDDAEAKADSDDDGEDEDDAEAKADSDDDDEDDTEAKADSDDGEDEDDAEAKADSDDGEDEDDVEAKADDDGKSKADDDGAEGRGDAEESEESSAVATEKEEQDGGGNGRVKASPVARRMARELGVELGGLEGSGPGGRIVKADVEAAAGDGAPKEKEEKAEKAEKAEKPKEKAPAGDGASGRGETTIEDLTRLQQTIARRMAESKATAPEFVITAEVDMAEAVEFRKQLKGAVGEDGIAPSFNDFVVKSAALALREFPRANGAYRDGKFELYSRINVGIAVAGQDALIVPTIFDADRKSLGEIARDARGLADKVREGKITPPELSSGTFSVSNLGMFGIKRFVAVINPPQAGILAVGEMTPRPVVRDGEVTVRPVMEITLSCDHRILYGADAAEFLGRIRERLENPLSLAL